MKKKISLSETLSRVMALLVIFILLSIVCPNFLTTKNLLNICNQASLNVFIAIGMTMAMLIAGIDLSVGSVVALTSVLAAGMFVSGSMTDMLLGLGISLGLGVVLGSINGALIAYLKLPAFLVTFGMSQIARGFAYLYMNGNIFNNFHERFLFIGKGKVAGIPMPILIALAALIIMGIVLKKTTLGRKIYTVGANSSMAKYSGIANNRITVLCYAASGFFAAMAGLIYISRLNAAEATIGASFANNAIAAAAIGGISFGGGKGNVLGTVIGALLLTLIQNGMNQLGITTEYQNLVTGLVIILAVLLDRKSAKMNR